MPNVWGWTGAENVANPRTLYLSRTAGSVNIALHWQGGEMRFNLVRFPFCPATGNQELGAVMGLAMGKHTVIFICNIAATSLLSSKIRHSIITRPSEPAIPSNMRVYNQAAGAGNSDGQGIVCSSPCGVAGHHRYAVRRTDETRRRMRRKNVICRGMNIW